MHVSCVTKNKLQTMDAKLTPTFIHLFIKLAFMSSFSKHATILFVFLTIFETRLNFLYKPDKFSQNPRLKLPFLQVIIVMCQGLNHINVIGKSVFQHLNDYICYTNKFRSLCYLNMFFFFNVIQNNLYLKP